MSIIDTLVTDRSAADVAAKNEKGTYNAADLNRVSEAVAYLRPNFAEFGYAVDDSELRTWAENELPKASEMAAYLSSVKDLDGHFVYANNMVKLPVSMARLTHEGANNIEKFLAEIHAAFDRMARAWYFADEIYSGEV